MTLPGASRSQDEARRAGIPGLECRRRLRPGPSQVIFVADVTDSCIECDGSRSIGSPGKAFIDGTRPPRRLSRSVVTFSSSGRPEVAISRFASSRARALWARHKLGKSSSVAGESLPAITRSSVQTRPAGLDRIVVSRRSAVPGRRRQFGRRVLEAFLGPHRISEIGLSVPASRLFEQQMSVIIW